MAYHGKKILVTGGTGTVGSALVRRLLDENPAVIRILSRDEHKQYELSMALEEHRSRLRFLIGDVRDQQRVARAMEDIDVVFHLAAMKHVPFCEYNPFEAVQTNVIGTQNVIQAAIENNVNHVIFTSSDKAISPSNTYGATKLTAEKLISSADYHKGGKRTIFATVRFGNVMGSRGSVIPLFKKQILEKGAVTVTNMDMVRYMMTPSQAIELIMHAAKKALGGEVFVLKMPVVKLADLVEVMIEEMTRKYNISETIKVDEIGLRPGEKMYEELMTRDEVRLAIEQPEMFIIPSQFTKRYPIPSTNGANHPIVNGAEEIPVSKETLRDWLISEQLI